MEVPEASTFAQTLYPFSRSERAKNVAPRQKVSKVFWGIGYSSSCPSSKVSTVAASTGYPHATSKVEQLTNISYNPSHDNLLLPSRFDSSTELSVIPSIYFTLALDQRGVRVHVQYRVWQRTIRSFRVRHGQLADPGVS